MENMVINNIALTKHNDKYTFKVYFKPETIDASYVSFSDQWILIIQVYFILLFQ